MTTKLQAVSIELQDRIFKEHYYISIYGFILEKLNLTTAQIEAGDIVDKDLLEMWSDFYFAIPDLPSVRRGPFFQLCDICESVFNDD